MKWGSGMFEKTGIFILIVVLVGLTLSSPGCLPHTQLARLQSGADRQGAADLLVR